MISSNENLSFDWWLGAAVSGQRDCGIALKSREWSRIYEIPVGAIEEEGHKYSATYEVVLRTDAHFHQPIWGLYELPPVKVKIMSYFISFPKLKVMFSTTGAIVLYTCLKT